MNWQRRGMTAHQGQSSSHHICVARCHHICAHTDQRRAVEQMGQADRPAASPVGKYVDNRPRANWAAKLPTCVEVGVICGPMGKEQAYTAKANWAALCPPVPQRGRAVGPQSKSVAGTAKANWAAKWPKCVTVACDWAGCRAKR